MPKRLENPVTLNYESAPKFKLCLQNISTKHFSPNTSYEPLEEKKHSVKITVSSPIYVNVREVAHIPRRLENPVTLIMNSPLDSDCVYKIH